jgi:hypothetical protein
MRPRMSQARHMRSFAPTPASVCKRRTAGASADRSCRYRLFLPGLRTPTLSPFGALGRTRGEQTRQSYLPGWRKTADPLVGRRLVSKCLLRPRSRGRNSEDELTGQRRLRWLGRSCRGDRGQACGGDSKCERESFHEHPSFLGSTAKRFDHVHDRRVKCHRRRGLPVFASVTHGVPRGGARRAMRSVDW